MNVQKLSEYAASHSLSMTEAFRLNMGKECFLMPVFGSVKFVTTKNGSLERGRIGVWCEYVRVPDYEEAELHSTGSVYGYSFSKQEFCNDGLFIPYSEGLEEAYRGGNCCEFLESLSTPIIQSEDCEGNMLERASIVFELEKLVIDLSRIMQKKEPVSGRRDKQCAALVEVVKELGCDPMNAGEISKIKQEVFMRCGEKYPELFLIERSTFNDIWKYAKKGNFLGSG
ncbi:hypothetical protein [Leucothrix pacifica]|uniref:Uncharacterized protein n=1 Tax=Leucothrix pacifica TaxID=1247513 RepID=A0A317CN08_9GAMM|nr:hypothetical protein [Leucothrix pacifica]PWQ97692.1 hypothetical protein DKW60_09960 [Leucothrix pacifica]